MFSGAQAVDCLVNTLGSCGARRDAVRLVKEIGCVVVEIDMHRVSTGGVVAARVDEQIVLATGGQGHIRRFAKSVV